MTNDININPIDDNELENVNGGFGFKKKEKDIPLCPRCNKAGEALPINSDSPMASYECKHCNIIYY